MVVGEGGGGGGIYVEVGAGGGASVVEGAGGGGGGGGGWLRGQPQTPKAVWQSSLGEQCSTASPQNPHWEQQRPLGQLAPPPSAPHRPPDWRLSSCWATSSASTTSATPTAWPPSPASQLTSADLRSAKLRPRARTSKCFLAATPPPLPTRSASAAEAAAPERRPTRAAARLRLVQRMVGFAEEHLHNCCCCCTQRGEIRDTTRLDTTRHNSRDPEPLTSKEGGEAACRVGSLPPPRAAGTGFGMTYNLG